MNEPDNKEFNDTSLLERIKSGDEQALDCVIQQYKNMVYATCLRLLKNTADAEDATQATFLILYKKCHKLKKNTLLGGWLYRTAGYVAKQSIRTSVRRKNREEKAELMNNQTDEVEKVWQDLEPELDKALLTLPEKFKDIVVLRYLEGKSTKETAELLSLSTSAVTTNLSRAIDKLKGIFNRKGIVVSSVLLTTTLTNKASAVTLPVSSALSAESLLMGGAVSANVVTLMDGALSEMNGFNSKVMASLVALVALIFVGTSYTLTQNQIDVLGLDEKQVELINGVFADTRQKYVDIEKENTTFLIEEDTRVKLQINPFPEELKKLTAEFWQSFDEVCNEYQRKVSRRYINPKAIYSFGDESVEIELFYEKKTYHYTEKSLDHKSSFISRMTQSGFIEEWSRFWGDRVKNTSSNPLLEVGSYRKAMSRQERSLYFNNGKPLLTSNFQETLDLNKSSTEKFNEILGGVSDEYMMLQMENTRFEGVDNTGEEKYKIESFSSEKTNLLESLWSRLETFLNERQMAIVKAYLLDSDLMPFGDYEYSVRLMENSIRYNIDMKYRGWMIGGSSSKSYRKKDLPDQYKKLRTFRH